jgi:hypothetical protein
MSNPSGADGDAQPTADDAAAGELEAEPIDAPDPTVTPERRFTAPSGFDAGKTQIINAAPEPETEIFSVSDGSLGSAAPQLIPGRAGSQKVPRRSRSWGWVIAVVLVIAALVAVAILGAVLLTRDEKPKASQEDLVRNTIQNFDAAIQKGDLATLRGITCGVTADGYIKYDDKRWSDIHSRVAAARQYPVVASIDQVVVHETHAEANVTTFMAFDPATRSTRSFDLEYRDEQWKICQAPQ